MTSQEPTPSVPDPENVRRRIDELRAEHDATDSAVARAILLHEVGVLQEMVGDPSGAARDQLEAVNVEPEFHEPLERLIQIIERSGSSKNLGKLLERLTHVADGAEERVRALLEHATYLSDVDGDSDAARSALEEAAEEKPDDPAVFLALEVLAGKQGDAALRQRALGTRAELCRHPTWRALLLLHLAELELAEGDTEGALAHVEAAIEQKGEATFLALLALEEIGKKSDRQEVQARSLEAQAALIIKSETDPTTADNLGVPRYRRNAAYAADAWLRAAEAHRRRGAVGDASALLDQALARAPGEPALAHARLLTAEVTGDTAKSSELARAEIERGAKGGIAAGLWLRVAEAAASVGDAPGALDAVRHALAEDPGSIPARVLELDLLDSGQEPQALASSLEATAESMSTDQAKARYFLAAADVWSRLGSDVGGAKAALSQAGMYGSAPVTIARVVRMLAAICQDAPWYEDGTRRLLAARPDEAEQVGVAFELARVRLLRGDHEHAKSTLAALTESTRGRWLGALLRAYAAPLAPNGVSGADAQAALAMLATLTDDPRASRALRMAMVVRAFGAHQEKDASEQLGALLQEDAGDLVAAGALSTLGRTESRQGQAAAVLAACAGVIQDAELATALDLEAGMLYWQTGERSAAVEAFNRAAGRSPASGGPVLSWALRAADPDSLPARRRALEALGDDQDAPAVALERFGLEAGSGGDPDRASEALDLVSSASDQTLRDAALLARALWGEADARAEALEGVAAFGGSAEAAARAAMHLEGLRRSPTDTEARFRKAKDWTDTDGSAAAALELFAATLATGDVSEEILARRELAARLPAENSELVQSGASLVSMLSGNDLEPLLGLDGPASRLANLELSGPGSDPRRRGPALLGVQGALGADSATLGKAMAGWSQLLAGDAEMALSTFREVVDAYPEELIGWEGLRASAVTVGDRSAEAEACAALGDAVHDDERGAELWEHSALILIDDLKDVARGEFALSRAVDRNIRRFEAFDRLFRLVRARKDGDRLLELAERRLDVADDPAEIAKLYWERARVLRESGDREGALAALENVTLLEPDHVGALALSGEIYLKTGKLPEAADRLARLSTLSDAPAKQRLMSGVAAVDIYENKLGEVEKALGVLDGLYRSGLSTLPVRERLARAAAKASAWEKATEVLEQLMQEREAKEGRIEAARLAMVIHRDRLGAPAGAVRAVSKLVDELPDDGEALDLVLSGALPPEVGEELLSRGRDALVTSLMREPLDAERVDRLARIAARLDNAPLRQATLGALVALGEGTEEIDRELAVLDQRVAPRPQMTIDPRALPDLCDPEDTGPIADLMTALASTFAEALGPGLAAFGIGKKERVDPRSGLPVRTELAHWAGALGLGDFELYVGGPDDGGVCGIATEIPALVVGRAVQAPLAPVHRQAVARELFALKRGTTILRHRDPTDIVALVVAACRLGGYEIPSPQYAMLGEFQRLLGKEISRKVKKVLPDLSARVASSGQDTVAWTRAATASLDRLAAIAAGDVSWVLSAGTSPRGQPGASIEAQERRSRVLAFVLSPSYLILREQLGMGVR